MITDKKVRLIDPYAALLKKDKTVTSIAVGDADRAFIYAINPQQSCLQTTVNCLLSQFVKAMRKAGYKHYDPEGFVHAIETMKIVVDKREKPVEVA